MVHWKVKVLALIGVLFVSSYYFNESKTRDLASVPQGTSEVKKAESP